MKNALYTLMDFLKCIFIYFLQCSVATVSNSVIWRTEIQNFQLFMQNFSILFGCLRCFVGRLRKRSFCPKIRHNYQHDSCWSTCQKKKNKTNRRPAGAEEDRLGCRPGEKQWGVNIRFKCVFNREKRSLCGDLSSTPRKRRRLTRLYKTFMKHISSRAVRRQRWSAESSVKREVFALFTLTMPLHG